MFINILFKKGTQDIDKNGIVKIPLKNAQKSYATGVKITYPVVLAHCLLNINNLKPVSLLDAPSALTNKNFPFSPHTVHLSVSYNSHIKPQSLS